MGTPHALRRALCRVSSPPRRASSGLTMSLSRPVFAGMNSRSLPCAIDARRPIQQQRTRSFATKHALCADAQDPVSESLRSVMRQMPHPVVVVTALDIPSSPEHAPSHWSPEEKLSTHGPFHPIPRAMTVSSFTSLSLRPRPLVQFNISLPSRSHCAILRARRFNIHILTADCDGARLASQFTHGLAAASSASVDADRRALGVLSGLEPLQVKVQGKEAWQQWWAQHCSQQSTGSRSSAWDCSIEHGSEPEPPLLCGPGVKHVLRCRHYTPEYLYPDAQQSGTSNGISVSEDRERFSIVLGHVESIEPGYQEQCISRGSRTPAAALSYVDGKYRGVGEAIDGQGETKGLLAELNDIDAMETKDLQRRLVELDQIKAHLEAALTRRAAT